MGEHLVEDGRLDVRPDGCRAQATVGVRCRLRGRPRLGGHDGPHRPIRLPCVLDGRSPGAAAPLARSVARTAKAPERGNRRHVLHGHAHRQIQRRGRLLGYHRHRVRAAEEARHRIARPHRSRQADALGGCFQQIVEPLQRQ